MISKSVDQLMDEILANLRQMFDNNEHAEVANAIVTAQTLATSLFYLTANGPITITTGSKSQIEIWQQIEDTFPEKSSNETLDSDLDS